MITEFGGAVAVPMAVRSSDSTTTMRVNDVIMIRIDGAIESTVSSAINWIARSVTPPLPWPRLMLMSCANAGAASDVAAIRLAKNKTLRGSFGGLTKGSSGGPATTPSRLRDFQIRASVDPDSADQDLGAAPRCAARGQAEARARPAARPYRRPGGEVQLPAAAPSRRDWRRRWRAREASAVPMEEAAAVAAPRRARARGPAAALSAVRSGAVRAASRIRCGPAVAAPDRDAAHCAQGGHRQDHQAAPA